MKQISRIGWLFTIGWMFLTPFTNAQTPDEWEQKEHAWKQKAADAYDFPIRPGMLEWNFQDSAEMTAACQIPGHLLKTMSTAGLVETCLQYPLLGDITASTTYQKGLEAVTAGFNGLQELFRRSDAGLALLERYKTMEPETRYQAWGGEPGKRYPSFDFLHIEVILAQDSILANMSREAKRSLLRESLRVFRDKQASEHYAEHTLTTPVRMMAKILEDANYEPLHHQIASIPPETEESIRQQILKRRPDMKNLTFTPVLVPIPEQYQSFLRGGYYGSDEIPEVIVLSAEQYLHETGEGGL